MMLLGIIILITSAISFAGDCGDVNNTGTVNIQDLTYLINFLYKGGPAPFCCGDVNGSGAVNIADITYLINYLYKGGPAPVCFKIPSTTTIIPQDSSAAIMSYDTTAGTVILDESSVYAQEVSVGDVIIGQDDEEAPNGFLRKVTAKTAQGGSIVLETEQATMMEAFETMDIAETHQLRLSDVVSYKLYNGSKFNVNKDDETFTVQFTHIFHDQDDDPETTDDQIRIDGEYKFTAAIFTKIQMSGLTLEKFETVIETNEEANINLIAGAQWVFADKEIELIKFKFGAIFVGGVVWIVPTITVNAHINGDLTVTMETGITFTQELRYGFGYANNEFYDISESTKDFTYSPPQFTAEFDFEPALSLNATCLLFGVAGPYAGGKVGLHFQSALNADPCDVELTFDLEAILYAVVGVECDILDLDYNKDFQLYTHPIYEWIYPLGGSGTIIIDPNPDGINAPWSLEGPCSYSTSGNGDNTLTSLDPGDYTITWGAVSGWTAPSNSMQTLAAAQTVTFSGTYVEEGSGTVTDIDGNIYQTKIIGTQEWMVENLKVTHYRNGEAIPNVTNGGIWAGLTTGAYCNYNNDVNNVATYGRLYNWYAVNDSRNIAPTGWHVPTDTEWKQLEMYLGMSQAEADATGYRGTDEGGKLKEAGFTHWTSPNTGATNESGFSALPGGVRNFVGGYGGMGNYNYFSSSTEFNSYDAWHRNLNYNTSEVYRNYYGKKGGYSVRCVKD
jgi:uncharacterized protein (TIGR02145 family)